MRATLLSLLLAGASLAGCSNVTEGFSLGSRSKAVLPQWTCETIAPIDANGDQLVDGGEWARYMRRAYSAWDRDGNGRVTLAEFENCWRDGDFYPAATPAAAQTAWAVFNADGNDYLSSYEFWSPTAWARVDANRNDVADAGEWTW